MLCLVGGIVKWEGGQGGWKTFAFFLWLNKEKVKGKKETLYILLLYPCVIKLPYSLRVRLVHGLF